VKLKEQEEQRWMMSETLLWLRSPTVKVELLRDSSSIGRYALSACYLMYGSISHALPPGAPAADCAARLRSASPRRPPLVGGGCVAGGGRATTLPLEGGTTARLRPFRSRLRSSPRPPGVPRCERPSFRHESDAHLDTSPATLPSRSTRAPAARYFRYVKRSTYCFNAALTSCTPQT
jgi:hypothetical protein